MEVATSPSSIHAQHGYFVVSLDFELFWGMFDKVSADEFGDRVLGARTAIPRTLEAFTKHGVHATWATVGMLMARTRQELLSLLPPPELRPTYEDVRVSSYHYLKTTHLGDSEKEDQLHFGSEMLQKIITTPFQEIGNHTFSHFYCIDGKENTDSVFAADLDAHERISSTYGIKTRSMAFPRNQAEEKALRVCKRNGIEAYRGTEDHFLYRPRKDAEQSLVIRGFRLLDHYVNLSGSHTYPLPSSDKDLPLNVKSSRFLRPFNPALALFEPLRMRRIKRAMTKAASRREVFHLWWHPHDFGVHQEENFRNLEEILAHFEVLRARYGMESLSMGELAARAREEAG
jgi:peptidoglycan/xylan/chitin deacetylase (PgdA/CDA1 family)